MMEGWRRASSPKITGQPWVCGGLTGLQAHCHLGDEAQTPGTRAYIYVGLYPHTLHLHRAACTANRASLLVPSAASEQPTFP